VMIKRHHRIKPIGLMASASDIRVISPIASKRVIGI